MSVGFGGTVGAVCDAFLESFVLRILTCSSGKKKKVTIMGDNHIFSHFLTECSGKLTSKET